MDNLMWDQIKMQINMLIDDCKYVLQAEPLNPIHHLQQLDFILLAESDLHVLISQYYITEGQGTDPSDLQSQLTPLEELLQSVRRIHKITAQQVHELNKVV